MFAFQSKNNVVEIVLSWKLVGNCILVTQTVKHETNDAKSVGLIPGECFNQSNVYDECNKFK